MPTGDGNDVGADGGSYGGSNEWPWQLVYLRDKVKEVDEFAFGRKVVFS